MSIHNPLAYSISDAMRVSSLGRTKLYQLIAAGEVDTLKIGRRTLVKADSLHRLLKVDS